MAFKMSPIGKKKCPYSPMQKRGLINPSPAMNNGDEKKVSSSSSSYQEGKKLTEEQLKAKQAELQRIANETGKSQSWSNMYSTGGKFDEVWKKMSEAEKAKHGNDFEKWKKKAKEYNEKMRQSLTADPQIQNKTKSEIKAKAEPVDKNIGTKLITERVIDPNAPKRWDGRLNKYVPNYIEVKKRVAVSTTADDKTSKDLDQNVTYSTTGDKDDVKNALDIDLTETQGGLENIRNEEVTVKSGGG